MKEKECLQKKLNFERARKGLHFFCLFYVLSGTMQGRKQGRQQGEL